MASCRAGSQVGDSDSPGRHCDADASIYIERCDGRSIDPIMSEEQWNSKLESNGLSGIEVTASDFDSSAHQMSMLVSRKLAESHYPRRVRISSTVSPEPRLVSELARSFGECNYLAQTATSPMHQIDDETINIIVDIDDDGCAATSSSQPSENIKDMCEHARLIVVICERCTDSPAYALARQCANVCGLTQENTDGLVVIEVKSLTDTAKLIQCVLSIVDERAIAETRHDTQYLFEDHEVMISRLIPAAISKVEENPATTDRNLSESSWIDQNDRIIRYPVTRSTQRQPAGSCILDPEGSYLICGEVGEAAFEVCCFLINSGAKHVELLVGQCSKFKQYQFPDFLRQSGVLVNELQPHENATGVPFLSWRLPLRGILYGEKTDVCYRRLFY